MVLFAASSTCNPTSVSPPPLTPRTALQCHLSPAVCCDQSPPKDIGRRAQLPLGAESNRRASHLPSQHHAGNSALRTCTHACVRACLCPCVQVRVCARACARSRGTLAVPDHHVCLQPYTRRAARKNAVRCACACAAGCPDALVRAYTLTHTHCTILILAVRTCVLLAAALNCIATH